MAEKVQPVFPIEGDIVHARDGMVHSNGITVIAIIKAPSGSQLTVNGMQATEQNGTFKAPLNLTKYRNIIEIQEQQTGETLQYPVYWASKFAGGYRLSIDDNIRFMQDIAEHVNTYNSIFDNPFLKNLKRLHDQYEIRVHLNMFYQSEQGDFNLSESPEKFATEWAAQRHWIRLSFHAYQEFPDAPYKHASFETVKKDCDLVQAEIKRISTEALMGPVTTVHWGEVNLEGSRALRAAGYKGQLGYFNVDDNLPPVSYYLDVDKRRHMKKRFIWKDEQEDIIFIRSSVVLDVKTKEEIIPFLESYRKTSGLPPYADFLIHEQYFYPDYKAYQPDYFEKIETAVQWAQQNGYHPAFLEECIFS